MLDVQGDRVLIVGHGPDREDELYHVLTIVHVVEGTQKDKSDAVHSLRLINRDDKSRKPDWLLTQKIVDHFQEAPLNSEGAKWMLYVKHQ